MRSGRIWRHGRRTERGHPRSYIGIVQHKENSPEVLSIPPVAPCIKKKRGIVSYKSATCPVSCSETDPATVTDMKYACLLIAMAVQTGSNFTIEFLGTIRILVAKYFNYRNELSGINSAGVRSEFCIDTPTAAFTRALKT